MSGIRSTKKSIKRRRRSFTYDSAKGVIGVTDPNTGYTALYAR